MLKQAICKLALVLLLLGLASCAPTAPPQTTSSSPPPFPPSEPLVYDFKFKYPAPPSQKMGITIGVVGADWGKKPLTMGPSAFSPMALSMNQDFASSQKATSKEETEAALANINVLKEFDLAIKKEFEAMMVNRGFNTMGFQSINDMTYPQKQSCNLVLIPEFNFSINSDIESQEKNKEIGKATLNGDIILNMIEPLSGQKVWMKRISLKPELFSFTTMKRFNLGWEYWDNRPQRLAGALSKFFIQVMQTSWNYFSPDEIAVMKNHSDEIRKLKRY
jgi:hypothetical protein